MDSTTEQDLQVPTQQLTTVLIGVLLATGLIPLAIVGGFTWIRASDRLGDARGGILLLAVVVVATTVGAAVRIGGKAAGSLATTSTGFEHLATSELPKLVGALRSVADGDLTAEPIITAPAVVAGTHAALETLTESHNVIAKELTDAADSFTVMTENLREIIGFASEISRSVQDNSDSLAESSDEASQAATDVADAIGSVAEGAVSQSAITEEVARAVAQIVEEVQNSTDTVDQVSAASQEAEEKAGAGRLQIDEATEAMERITASFGQVAGTVAELGERSEKIEEIVDLIRSIAEQTNLLALNAAIEAARAGEAGRGFAVVASEVKALAEESASSTEQIARLVGEMRGSVQEARQATETGRQDVDRGADVIGAAGEAFSTIVDAVGAIDGQVKGLAEATGRISTATDSIGSGVRDLIEVAESNSAASEQVAASSEETAAAASEIGGSAQQLAGSARDLAGAMRKFTFGDGSLDFGAAISAHRAWKARISNFIKGREELHTEDVASHKECELGIWLYGKGMADYGEFPEMASLERDHKILHERIKTVVTSHKAGDEAGTQKSYADILSLSDRVVEDLTKLQHRF